jgi:acyl-coenzyme A synthetase/AMP-(fatty) acid ligase
MKCLRVSLENMHLPGERVLVSSSDKQLSVEQLLQTSIKIERQIVDGCAVGICLHSTTNFIQIVMALDGRASKLVLVSPDLERRDIQTLLDVSGAECLISDRVDLIDISVRWELTPDNRDFVPKCETAWLMTTSGTTGLPKIVAHTLKSLTATVQSAKPWLHPVWGLLYDASRFAGLQVVLQSMLGGGRLVAPNRSAPFVDQISYLISSGCTHLSATPTLWRKILMLPSSQSLELQQITLGGESADARILHALATQYGKAKITHIYASTEIGVGFSVKDGKPGFPLHCLESTSGRPRFKIKNGLLWAKPHFRNMQGTKVTSASCDENGYINTEDTVAVVDGRVLFQGRIGSVANIGGIKVKMSHVEDIIRQHSSVLDCHVTEKPNPITGSILTLLVVARKAGVDRGELCNEIRKWCRECLPPEARPANMSIVDELNRNASGKVTRPQ